jgi:hypothetical protein
MLKKLYIIDTESKIWSNSPDSDARVHKAGIICAYPWFPSSLFAVCLASCFMNKCKGGNININSQAVPNTSSAASERAFSEHFSAPFSSLSLQHDDTANTQCRLWASYFQDALSNLASYPKSLPDISPDPSSSIQHQKDFSRITLIPSSVKTFRSLKTSFWSLDIKLSNEYKDVHENFLTRKSLHGFGSYCLDIPKQ